MCKKRKFLTFACCPRLKNTFFNNKHFTKLGMTIFCRITQKSAIIIEFWQSFPTLPHTHWEHQAVHKTHYFEWNGLTKPDWATRCLRKTHSHHCRARVWCPVMLAWVSLVRFSSKDKNTERKIGDRRSGEMSYRDISLEKNEKLSQNFEENASNFWRAQHGGLGTFWTSN